ncbi:MAG: hypothetical protein DRQ44_13010 [Gammaproteobacteria bacterium]|nr:MAG: hypothetical protein DRQ44_13010 [Gammaproteobacteria bacterium]
MAELFQKNCFYMKTGPGRASSLAALLFFISAVVFAGANGIIQLPDSYRTPLSDMVYDDNKEWRSEPEDENPWREDEEELILQPRLKAEFFPQYNYDSIQNPNPGSLFQNENEIDKPVSNIFKYTF